MILLELFLGFLRVGCFAFGGAYGAIPLIIDVVTYYGWMPKEMLAYMIGVSESTPGPIMVNIATYVGSTQAGLPGALIATLAVVLPAFIIIILISMAMRSFSDDPYVRAVMGGLKPCITGIIMATGIYMAITNIAPLAVHCKIDWKAIIITVILAGVFLIYRFMRRKKMSPILLIILAAVLGIIIYGI